MISLDGLHQHPEPLPYPFGPRSVAGILDAGLAAHPDRLALIDGDRTWTWDELDSVVAAVAGGIAPGEQIWWALGNCAEQVIGALATFRAGAIWIGRAEKHPQLALPDVVDRLGTVRLIDSVEGLPSGVNTRPDIDPHAPALVTFTSGTSGRPKAVVHSQHNLLWPGLLSLELEPPIDGERTGTPLSLGIANVLALAPLSALLRGTTTVVMHKTFARGFAEEVERRRVTRCFVVPTILHDLVSAPDVPASMLRSLDRVIAGGSGAEPRILSEFLDNFHVRPTLSYGLSEAPTGVVRESMDDPIGSGRGFPLPHVEVSILDPSGAPVPIGKIGEVCLAPATTGRWANTWTPTLGYLGEPERTTELFRGDVLHTGDLGRLDSDGAVSVVGRLSDLIIRGGKNIDPLELEERLSALPAIREALVVGMPDSRLGQRVGALIVLDGTQATVDFDRLDLVELAMSIEEQSGLAFDALAVVQSLPRNEMGKVVRQIPGGLLGPDNLLR